MAIKGMGQEHHRLEVGRDAHRDVHPNVLWEAIDEELHLLVHRDVTRVHEDRPEAVRKFLDHGVKR